MPFISPDTITKKEIFPGGHSALASGARMMLSFLDMAEGATVPKHSHPQEQAGVVLAGRLRLTIGEQERILDAGDAYVIPGGTIHFGTVVAGPLRVLDVFSPPREDYVELMD